ncbi:MAG: SH3 domain-containing protein [Telluria sp.]
MNAVLMTLAAYGAGLIATLVLAAFLTPRNWWRRANARALAVLAGGTLVMGSALAWLFAPPASAQAAALAAPPAVPLGDAPEPGARYRVFDDLNLRGSRSVGARRLGVVPAGAIVTATGEQAGDWWEITARVDGDPVRGWASSLWLRRLDEKRR